MPSPMGGTPGAPVQADETWHLNTSKRAKGYKSRSFKDKANIVALIDEGTGTIRTFHVEKGATAVKMQ
jgi:hypothetical protein